MSRSMVVVALAACGIVMLGGCGSSAATSSAPEQLKPEEEMRRFESDFRPSDYDPDPTGGVTAERVRIPAPDSAAVDPYAMMTEEMSYQPMTPSFFPPRRVSRIRSPTKEGSRNSALRSPARSCRNRHTRRAFSLSNKSHWPAGIAEG